ncbi:MAG TPA: hypothetical protein VGF98_09825 [Candidatus Tumulicola sp.]|jgi:hypothetical protein
MSVLAAAALTGCAASTPVQSSIPSTTTGAAIPAAKSTIAGQYQGTGKDSQYGKGEGAADLSQSGKAVGGALGFEYQPQNVDGSAALIDKAGALAGTMTVTIGSVACSFTVAAAYDDQKFTLDGTYTAKHGCTGETGTFKLKERCYYIDGIRTHNARRARPAAGGLKPC